MKRKPYYVVYISGDMRMTKYKTKEEALQQRAYLKQLGWVHINVRKKHRQSNLSDY